MKWARRLLLVVLLFTLSMAWLLARPRIASLQSAIPPAPAVSAKPVLRIAISGAGRRGFALGQHAFLASLRYGLANEVLPARVRGVVRNQPVWALQFLDSHISTEPAGVAGIPPCAMTWILLSASHARELARVCTSPQSPLPHNLSTLPPPEFPLGGMLRDIQCQCSAGGPGGFRFHVGRHAYLSVLRYGCIRDLFPGNSLGKGMQSLRIWTLTYLDPQVAADKHLAGRNAGSICAKNTVDLRASDGTDEAWACYSQG